MADVTPIDSIESPPPTRGWTSAISHHSPCPQVSPAYAGMDPTRRKDAEQGRRLPRLRGDGPWTEGRGQTEGRSPPPTRGWTLRRTASRAVPNVSPAYAGMDLCPTSAHAISGRLPRLRGDGPGLLRSVVHPARSPPPTRGWTRLAVLLDLLDAVSPAYAGMDPPRPAPWCQRTCLPRLRGDGPGVSLGTGQHVASPPPTRGWTREKVRTLSGPDVSPAYAGMDPARRISACAPRCLPRLRGDGPFTRFHRYE